jgi:hypothetical protein
MTIGFGIEVCSGVTIGICNRYKVAMGIISTNSYILLWRDPSVYVQYPFKLGGVGVGLLELESVYPLDKICCRDGD